VTLEDLRVFLMVAQSRNLSHTAKRLDCTQPAVAQHVARLERELGMPLFDRHRHGVSLTRAGKIFRDAVAEATDALDAGRRRIDDIGSGIAGDLALATGGTTIRYFLRTTLVAFRERFPDVAFRVLQEHSTTACIEAVRDRRSDLAFVTLEPAPKGVQTREAARLDLRLLVMADDPWSQRASIDVQQIGTLNYIALPAGSSTQKHINRALDRAGVAATPLITVGDFDTAGIFVELGLGHAVVPAVHAWHFVQGRKLSSIPIHGLEAVPVGWAMRRWSHLPRAAKEFVAIFEEEIERMEGVPGLTLGYPA